VNASRAGEAVLVRHAETEWSLSGRHTGRTDIPLTEHGRVLAAGLRERLRAWSFDLVLVSPSVRAGETCELCGLGAAAQPRDDLLEWDYGDYEGMTTAEIRAERPGWQLWRDGCPGGESATDVGVRCSRMDICCACSAPAGSGSTRASAGGWGCRRRRSACSATSARRR
jgi:broad specificity phosphatase PhoE